MPFGGKMHAHVGLIGMRYERLVVLRRDLESSRGQRRWVCQCDCGNLTSAITAELNRGNVRSCGCLMVDLGKSRRRYDQPMNEMSEYHSWRSMIKRCLDPNSIGYENYGGRGITVNPEWLETFDNFYRDMGPKPTPEHSIERKDSDGNYVPDNCRWATAAEQGNNKRNCIYFELDGESLTLPVIARKLSLNYSRLYWHTNRGLSLEEAVSRVRARPSQVKPRENIYITDNGILA